MERHKGKVYERHSQTGYVKEVQSKTAHAGNKGVRLSSDLLKTMVSPCSHTSHYSKYKL